MNNPVSGGTTSIDGVVIGVVAAIAPGGDAHVAFPGNRQALPIAARTTVRIGADAVGREVALMFEGGDVRRPIILGLVQHPDLPDDDAENEDHIESTIDSVPGTDTAASGLPAELLVDNERLELEAHERIVLKCGKASITLTRAGKVIIRGAYVSTRSSGVHRIRGGSVQIN